eukprot:6210592-Prymnesium_polylepis.1
MHAHSNALIRAQHAFLHSRMLRCPKESAVARDRMSSCRCCRSPSVAPSCITCRSSFGRSSSTASTTLGRKSRGKA